jgi:outer membrane immunogenic protein
MKKTEARAWLRRAPLSSRAVQLGGLFAGMIATPVAAADLPVKALPVAAPVTSWTQFYVGAGFGFDLATGRSSVLPTGGGPGLGFEGLQGADLGLSPFAGVDLQVSQNIVLGVFADYDWSHQKTSLSADWVGNARFSGTMPTQDRSWTIGGRAGFLISPDVFLYGLAGYTETRFDNWSYLIDPGFVPAFGVHPPAQTLRGYTVGAGVEYRLANNVSLRGEYRYVGLGSATTVDAVNGQIWMTDLSQHVVRISAAYRFGQFGTAAPAASTTRMAAPSWTGFYIGAGIGGDAIVPHVSGTVGGQVDVNGAGLGGGDVGGTVMVGYDRQVAPQWVVGAFALVDAATNAGVKFRATAIAGGAGGISSDLAAVDWSGTVGGRIGYLVAPNTLVYALGGYTGLTLHSVSYDLFGVTGTGPTPQYNGATFGGGFERYFTDTISARAEYRGTHLEKLTNLAAPGWTNLSAGGTVHTLRAVLSYRIPTL